MRRLVAMGLALVVAGCVQGSSGNDVRDGLSTAVRQAALWQDDAVLVGVDAGSQWRDELGRIHCPSDFDLGQGPLDGKPDAWTYYFWSTPSPSATIGASGPGHHAVTVEGGEVTFEGATCMSSFPAGGGTDPLVAWRMTAEEVVQAAQGSAPEDHWKIHLRQPHYVDTPIWQVDWRGDEMDVSSYASVFVDDASGGVFDYAGLLAYLEEARKVKFEQSDKA